MTREHYKVETQQLHDGGFGVSVRDANAAFIVTLEFDNEEAARTVKDAMLRVVESLTLVHVHG
jgi:hypothetical protein